MALLFNENEANCTLGVEMELQVLDAERLLLIPRGYEIIQAVNSPRLAKEMFRSTLEIVTGICNNVHDVHHDFLESLEQVKSYAEKNNLRFAGTGTHPLAMYQDRITTTGKRYQDLMDRNQWLIRRMAVYGLHVHIGMHNAEECMRFNHFFLRFVPHLIALSASSPYWQCSDTGLAAARPTMYEAHPTSGIPYLANDWSDFERVYHAMIDTGSIESMKDIWWDIRPSPTYGTLELRMCDGPATLLELESIVALIHVLALWFNDHGDRYFKEHRAIPDRWVLRENKWRVIRNGIDAVLIDPDTLHTEKFVSAMSYWLEQVQPYAEKLGYENYMQTIKQILTKGNSAQRQRDVFKNTGSLEKVVAHNVAEFEQGKPQWM